MRVVFRFLVGLFIMVAFVNGFREIGLMVSAPKGPLDSGWGFQFYCVYLGMLVFLLSVVVAFACYLIGEFMVDNLTEYWEK